ncbi:MAG TPA: GYD domain-containing protein [Nitrospiraceae bacterium]|nr:GYD domain-containing protein [Nitrospiraceae bacterium]
MPTYISLVKFTHQGVTTMKEKGVERADAVRKNAQSLGGKLLQAYYCLGEYDVIAIWDFPDNRTAMKAAVLNAAMGHIHITTMPAVARDEWKQILQETVGKRK